MYFRQVICEANRVSYQDSIRYETYLVKRIQMVKDVIDSHLEAIKPELVARQLLKLSEGQDFEGDEREWLKTNVKAGLDGLTYEERLSLLRAHTDLLVEGGDDNG